jgi:hypothetical protein
MNEATFTAYVTHARKFSTEAVYETARQDVTTWARQAKPRPADLAWMTPDAREQVFTEREAYRRQLEEAQDWLLRLRVELDTIEANRKRGHYTVGNKRRRSPEETVAAARLLLDEGLVELAVANRLGVSKKRLRQLVRDHAKPGAQTRMVTRQNGARNENLRETLVAA